MLLEVCNIAVSNESVGVASAIYKGHEETRINKGANALFDFF
jgi:hypothetical protein